MDQIQSEIDADGNGEIDFEEFLSIMKSDLLRWGGGDGPLGRKMHFTSGKSCINNFAFSEMQLVDDRERRLRTALETIENDERKIRRNHLIRLLTVTIDI